jgi:hypothetical protein
MVARKGRERAYDAKTSVSMRIFVAIGFHSCESDGRRMTLPRKGSRIVQVGAHEYVWRIRKKPTYAQGAFQAPMRVAIQRSRITSAGVLVVNLLVSRPDNWISPHQTAVTPSVIRDIIARAIAEGWDPEKTEPFALEYGLIRDRA